ncbi:MAG: chemotaxis protein CheW [bacterium]
MKLALDTSYLLFIVNFVSCAFKLTEVDRVISFSSDIDVVSIPGSKYFIEGITEWDNHVLPIFNLRKWFNLQENVYKDREWVIIIIKIDNEKYGFLVDNVISIATLEMLQKSTANGEAEISMPVDKRFIREIIYINCHPFIILELEQLFHL